MEEIAKDMKYYAYYREAYGAVLDGMVGYFEQESGNDKVWLRKYGLKGFSPIPTAILTISARPGPTDLRGSTWVMT